MGEDRLWEAIGLVRKRLPKDVQKIIDIIDSIDTDVNCMDWNDWNDWYEDKSEDGLKAYVEEAFGLREED